VSSYNYVSSKPHAVTSAGGNSYSYDLNGNMTSRNGATLTYDAENRLKSVTQGSQTTTFTYDADGQRVMRKTVTDTIAYIGSHYEKQILPQDLDGGCVITVGDIMQVASRWRCRHGDDCYDAVASMIQTPPTPAASSDRVRPCSPQAHPRLSPSLLTLPPHDGIRCVCALVPIIYIPSSGEKQSSICTTAIITV
jgi:YD repeat-containing protein